MRMPTTARRVRRGFNLIELLIALGISAALLTATMVALDASFMAYQATTEQASTHTIGRLILHRVLTLIRSGTDFEPAPADPTDLDIESDDITFVTPDGATMTMIWSAADEALYIDIDGDENLLLEGVVPQIDPDTGLDVAPFKLEWQDGTRLYRATVDLAIVPDDNMDLEIEGENVESIRLVGSAMPRNYAID